jgi:F-type H+-transporting ATPase subunit gamma
MAAQIRVLRRRIRSVSSTKKITRAMELIAASRIVKAQQRVQESKPYAEEITRVVTAMASAAGLDSPLTTERHDAGRAALLVITSDRGLAGAYNSSALKKAEELIASLQAEGKETDVYAIGRKAVGYFTFRGRTPVGSYTGFSEQPSYADAKRAADELIAHFTAEASEDDRAVDEIHLVFTEFVSALTQRPQAVRVLPLVIEQSDADEAAAQASFEFEPGAEAVLEPLLPRYVEARLYAALLQSAASESASRRRAMKAATDNASDLIRALTREMNAARQAEITQEISEIVGGADALASA